MRDFTRRVDAAIPVKFPKGEGKLKLEEKKRKKKEEQAAKEAENVKSDADDSLSEDEDPEEDIWKEVNEARGKKKTGKRGESPDPWAELEKKRAAPKFGEVADAPPVLKRPREVFKMYTGAGVNVEGIPKNAGSLMKREELAGERRNIVDAYRRMMEEKRKAAGLEVKLDRL